jgi:hypothetical protein
LSHFTNYVILRVLSHQMGRPRTQQFVKAPVMAFDLRMLRAEMMWLRDTTLVGSTDNNAAR